MTTETKSKWLHVYQCECGYKVLRSSAGSLAMSARLHRVVSHSGGEAITAVE